MMTLLARAPSLKFLNEFRWGTKAHDLIAMAPLLLWYGFSVVALSDTIHTQLTRFSFARPDYSIALTIISKFAVLLFAIVVIGLLFLRLPPKNGAQGFLPRLAAIFGTYLSVGVPLLLRPANVPPAMLALSTILIIGGMAFALHAVLHLGRSFSVMAEARRLVTTGPYAWIRHPLYLGEEFAIVGVVLQYISPAAIAILVCQMACQIYRMGREERVLGETFPEYLSYKTKTARLVPGVY